MERDKMWKTEKSIAAAERDMAVAVEGTTRTVLEERLDWFSNLAFILIVSSKTS